MTEMTGGQALVRSIYNEGVRVIFRVAGRAAVPRYGCPLRHPGKSALSPRGMSRPPHIWPMDTPGQVVK